MKELNAAVEFAKSGDAAAAITSLLAAWKQTFAPEIAEALDRVTAAAKPGGDFAELAEREDPISAAWLIDQLSDMNAAGAAGAISKLGWIKNDPRAAAGLVKILAAAPWHSTGAKPFWTRFFALLDANPDPRSLALLSKPGRVTSQVNGATMRAWFGEKIDKSCAKLDEAVGTPAKTPKAIADLAASVKLNATSAPAPKATGGKKGPLNEAGLYAAVYASPDDDAPRTVLSDFLIEKGDPRGEFLSLQLKRTELTGDAGREGALLQKHQPAWLGEFAGIVKYKNAYLYGPQPYSWGMHVAIRWHRGFLAGANVDLTGPKLKKLAPRPEWATLEYLLGLQADAKNEKDLQVLFGSLRGLKGMVARLPLLKLVSQSPLVNRLHQLNLWLSDEDAVEAMALADGFPALKALEVHYTKNASALVKSKAFARVEELRFFSTITIRREAGGTHVGLGITVDPFPAWAEEVLAAIDPKTVTSTSVTGYTRHKSYFQALERFGVTPTEATK